MDEAYVCGVRHGGKRGRGAAGKTIVLGMKDGGGRLERVVIPNVKTDTLKAAVTSVVEPGSIVSTDELISYGLVKADG